MASIYPSIASTRPVNVLLTDKVAGLMNKPDRFIGLQALPEQGFGVSDVTGVITVADPSAFMGDGSTNLRRAPGAQYPSGQGPQLTTPITYAVEEYGFKDYLDDANRASAEIDAWSLKLTAIANRLSIQREVNFADLIMTAANWSNSFSAGTAWSASGSDPFSDMETAQNFVDQYGLGVNTCVMDNAAFRVARKNAALLSFLSLTENRNYITENDLATAIKAAFNIEQVHILKASRNTANAGAAATISRISSGTPGKVWFGYIERNIISVPGEMGNSLETAATAAVRVTQLEPEAKTWRSDDPPGEYCSVAYREALAKVLPQLGCLISGVA